MRRACRHPRFGWTSIPPSSPPASINLGELDGGTDRIHAGNSVSAVGDVNGDGTADILLRRPDGTVMAWTMRDGALATCSMAGIATAAWQRA